MSGDIELHRQAGLAIALLVALSFIVTLLLIGAALRDAINNFNADGF